MKKSKRLPEIITIPLFALYTLISIPLELLGFWRCFQCGKIGWIYKDRITRLSMTGDEVHFCKECNPYKVSAKPREGYRCKYTVD